MKSINKMYIASPLWHPLQRLFYMQTVWLILLGDINHCVLSTLDTYVMITIEVKKQYRLLLVAKHKGDIYQNTFIIRHEERATILFTFDLQAYHFQSNQSALSWVTPTNTVFCTTKSDDDTTKCYSVSFRLAYNNITTYDPSWISYYSIPYP